MNPRANREQIAELFFETYRAPAIFFSPPAVLSLYASGRATGVVLDVGEGVTHCVPVYEGYALKHSITRSDVAGRDVTKQLQLLLRKSGLAFTTTAESDLVKTMKEELCYVHQNVSGTDDRIKPGVGSSEDTAQAVYQLPDGQTVSISNERHLAPEVLFNPSLIGSEEVDVASALVNSIMKSDLDLRPTLFSQIVLAGGSTCTSGFGDRLLTEVRAKAPTHTRIRISAPPDRIHSAWAGGSILASLATFKNMWVTKAEYEEYGKEVLHRSGL
jgi:centractin